MPSSRNKNIDTLRQSFISVFHFPPSFSANKRRFIITCIAIICILYILSTVFYLLRRFNVHSGDFTLYYSIVSKTLDGQIPFRDFPIEYPVLSLIPILIPGLVNQLFSGSFESYCSLFVLQNILLCVLTGYVISRTRITGMESNNALLTYILFSVFSLPLYLYRFDAFPILLTSIVVFTIFTKPFISGMTWAASIMVKLYPIVMAPAVGLYFLINLLLKRGLAYLAGVILFSTISLAIILPITGPSIFNFAQPHQLRGIQLESIIGGLILLANKMNLIQVTITHNYGSFNIDSSISQGIVDFMKLGVGVIFLLIFLFQGWLFIKEKQLKGTVSQFNLILAITIWLLSFMIFNKVLSPQYILWLFPLISFLNRTIRIKFIVALMLTITIFPGWYHYLIQLNAFLVIMLNIRNFLLIWILSDTIKLMLHQVFNTEKDRSIPNRNP